MYTTTYSCNGILVQIQNAVDSEVLLGLQIRFGFPVHFGLDVVSHGAITSFE